MGITYLRGRRWNDWSREERFFCAALYAKVAGDAAGFAEWLNSEACLGLTTTGDWDAGYEICFYRDYLWQLGLKADDYKAPQKRTFDLCLFGERTIIVIEAKVFEPFDFSQNKVFESDKELIRKLPELGDIETKLVALASSKYFPNQEKFGRSETLGMFDGRITWNQVATRYPDSVFEQADLVYKIKPGAIFA